MTANKFRIRSKRLVSVDDHSEEMDTIKSSIHKTERRSYQILMQAAQCWANMSRFRETRARCKRYTYGDQWKDYITVDHKTMTEEEYILSQGNIPLKNNHIRRLVTSVLSTYRSQAKEPTCTARDREDQRLGEVMSATLQCNQQRNKMTELNARTFEDFLIGGLAVHKKTYGYNNDVLDCWTKYINPNDFFIDSDMKDFRGWDVHMLGEVHEDTFESICSQFAKSPADYERLRVIYGTARSYDMVALSGRQFGYDNNGNYDFLFPSDPTKCKVIEVWNKEMKPRYRCHDLNNGTLFKIEIGDLDEEVLSVNRERIRQGVEAGMNEDDIPLIEAEWFLDNYWYCRYYAPTGEILKEGETPYEHKSHPYVFKAYPYIDREIHSFVADIIDQQRYVNRLISLYDWIMRTSAKGVLLMPEGCQGDGYTLKDIADQWSRFNGVIVYKPKAGVELPKQIVSNSTNIGIGDLLQLQLKFFEDISGVSGALQGKPGFSGMSASLYAQQTQNASTTLLDILDTFSEFVIDGATKDIANIQQFYTEKRLVAIAGQAGRYVEYNPEEIKDIVFQLAIHESTTTPVYRQFANDFIMEIWKSGQISLEQMLENGNFPFADTLLQSIKSQKEQIAQGKVPDALSPALQQQINALPTNPRAQQMLQSNMAA